MNIAMAFHALDKAQVERWLKWVEKLGGIGSHRLFIMPSKGERADFKTTIPFTEVKDHYGIVSQWSHSNAKTRDAAGPNSTIRQFAWYFAGQKSGPWMFCEPDCIPLRASAFDEWEAEYKRANKAFMGGLVNGNGDYPTHSTGNMMLPQWAAERCPKLMIPQIAEIDGQKVELAFDIAAAAEILANHHETTLIQHVFRGETFDKPEDMGRIDPRAAFFHTDKDGGLIRLLESKLSGPAASVAEQSVYPARCLPSLMPQGRTNSGVVFTYFAPVKSKEGRAEQDAILNIWADSWKKAGFTPRILMEDDARSHPDFAGLSFELSLKPTINPPLYEAACWNRWIAMAAVGGGFMVDYDVLPNPRKNFLDVFVSAESVPLVLCPGVPCAVVGTAKQYFEAIWEFIGCAPSNEGGHPHLSDMHAVQQLGFPSISICQEYGTEGWEHALLWHFNHHRCAPRSRSECMANALNPPEAPEVPVKRKPGRPKKKK